MAQNQRFYSFLLLFLFATLGVYSAQAAELQFRIESYILDGKVDSAEQLLAGDLSSIAADYTKTLKVLAANPKSDDYSVQLDFVSECLNARSSSMEVSAYVERNIIEPSLAKTYSRPFVRVYWLLMTYYRNEGDLDKANKLYEALTKYLENTKSQQSSSESLWAKATIASHECIMSYISKDREKGYAIAKKIEADARDINDTNLIVSGLYYQCDYFFDNVNGYIELCEQAYSLDTAMRGGSSFSSAIKGNLVHAYMYAGGNPERVDFLLNEIYNSQSRQETYILYVQSLGSYTRGDEKLSEIYQKFGTSDILSFCDTMWSLGTSELDIVTQKYLAEEIVRQLTTKEYYKEALQYELKLRDIIQELYDKDLVSATAELNAKLALSENKVQLEKISARSRTRTAWLLGVLGLLTILLVYLYFKYTLGKKQQQLAEASSLKLEKLNKVKDTFFANISHELRTPLTLISGPLQQILAMPPKSYPKEVKNHVELANTVAARLHGKVEGFLKLGSIEHNRIKVNATECIVDDLILEIASPFKVQAELKSVQLTIDSSLESNYVHGLDEEHFRTILNNLLSNAIKHSPADSKVALKAKLRGSNLLVQVVDQGPGIEQSDIGKIFKPYYQTETGEKAGGFGIGLSLSKQLAIIMDGELYFHSVPGEHTTFELELPPLDVSKSKSQLEPLQTRTKHVSSTNYGKRHSILLIDDQPEMVQYLESILEENFKVYKAYSSDQAIKMLNETAIDIITTDLMMAGTNGQEFVQVLKKHERWRHLPLLVISAKDSSKDKVEMFNLGVDGYVVKPFLAAELKARLLSLVAKKNETKGGVTTEVVMQDSDEAWLKSVKEHIQENISDYNLRIPDVAEQFGLTERTFRRKLKTLSGVGPNAFVKEIRLTYARDLLMNKAYNSVKEVAYASGFSRADFFAKEFQKRFGQLPNTLLK